jgi:hypothetical protein
MYKDCCSRYREPAPVPAFESATRELALSKLMAFAFQPVFDADHSEAEAAFWGDRLRAAAPGAVQRLLDSDDAVVKYNSWFLFDWEVDKTATVAELFLEERSHDLSSVEWQVLETLSGAHLRLYEVERVERGRDVGLLDLWTGERRVVTEGDATCQLAIWDVLGARVVPDGTGWHRFEGGLYRYSAEARDVLLTRFRRAHRIFQRRHPEGTLTTFFRKHGALFHHVWLELVAFPEPPEVLTTEGDPLMFCRAVFDTERVEDVRPAIEGHRDVRRTPDGRLVLHEAADAGAREIGRWSIEDARVVFETTSQPRAVRGRRWLEALVGDLVQYRATAIETLDQAMEGLRRPGESRALERVPEHDARAVRALFDRHYRSWLDRPEPELGDRTPRAAARTKRWRPKVTDLLKRLENAAARAALAGRPHYDFRWIWAELGLDRPDPVR